jgi:lipoate-protein ligase A
MGGSDPERWRRIDCGAVTPYENAAMMPVLSRNVAGGADPIATASVWGQTHLNVGWFDDVDSTLDLDACARLGVAVIRRPLYGGGTAFYDAGCAVMWGFLLPKDRYDDLDDALARFQPVVLDALAKLGLGEVVFEGSSDLRWHGRKLGALTAQDVIACNSVGGFLNIAPPNLDLYLQVVRVPDDKFKDKAVKDMREYVCTAQEVARRPVTYEEFRDALFASLEASGIELTASELSDGERHGLSKIGARIGGDEMVRRISSARFTADAPDDTSVGFGNHKGRKLCRAGVAVDTNRVIVDALMAGDMHVSPPDTMDRVAAALVGASVDDCDDLRRRIASVFEGDDIRQAESAMGVTTDDLLSAVGKAIDTASGATRRGKRQRRAALGGDSERSERSEPSEDNGGS